MDLSTALFLCLALVTLDGVTAKDKVTATPLPTAAVPAIGQLFVPEAIPSFPSNIGTWTVNETDNTTTCIRLKSAIQLSLNWTDLANKTFLGNVDVPITATSQGLCSIANSTTEQSLTLTWNVVSSKDNMTHVNQITFNFTESLVANQTSGNFSLKEMSIRIFKDGAIFPNATSPNVPFTYALGGTPKLTTPLNSSYSCQSTNEIKSVDELLTVRLESFQLEAFSSVPSNTTEFSKAIDCPGDIVEAYGLAVGAIVAIIVILVLGFGLAGFIIHLVRKQKKAQGGSSGYENM